MRRIEIRGDSQLVVDQIMKVSSCHSDVMAAYCQEVCKLEGKFDALELKHIPRWCNEAAGSLVKMASGRETIPPGIFANDQYMSSVRSRVPADDGNESNEAGTGVE